MALARGDGAEAARKGLQTALDIAQAQGARLFVERARAELEALDATCAAGSGPG